MYAYLHLSIQLQAETIQLFKLLINYNSQVTTNSTVHTRTTNNRVKKEKNNVQPGQMIMINCNP